MLESPHNEATNTVRNAISVLGRAVAILQKCPPDTELKAVSEVEEVNNLLRPLVLLSQPRKRKNCEPRVAISGHTLRRKARLNERKSEGQKALAQHPNLQFRGTGQQSVTQHDRPDSRGNKQTSGSGQDTSPHTDTFKVDSAVEEQAQFWMSDPASFWLDITAKDCGVPDGQSNLARFLCTALKVGNDTQIYTIKWRFYALVTYLLYKRIFCGSKNVMKDKIEQLSVQVGMTDSRQALKDLAVAGRRINDFKPSGDFGFLFNSLIPNSV
ncbi:hypothetical protein [Streptomyces eurythermus]|jgi:hypothetical protein|uniref:hypothetical protein n=1 Tax=Streptomyces eurythermus TaxID=42237 RepID=UPI0033F5E166